MDPSLGVVGFARSADEEQLAWPTDLHSSLVATTKHITHKSHVLKKDIFTSLVMIWCLLLNLKGTMYTTWIRALHQIVSRGPSMQRKSGLEAFQ